RNSSAWPTGMPTKKMQWSNDIQSAKHLQGHHHDPVGQAPLGTSPRSSWPSNSRAHVAITITMYTAALSPPEIWSFARSKSVNTKLSAIWEGPYIIRESFVFTLL